MSRSPTSPDADVQRLLDEGYDVALVDGMLVMSDVPYVTGDRTIARGVIAAPVRLLAGRIAAPDAHSVWWVGDAPCDRHGRQLEPLIAWRDQDRSVAGLVADFLLCQVPTGRDFRDYHEMLTTYVGLLSSHAAARDPDADARVHRTTRRSPIGSAPFAYADSATARAGTGSATDRVRGRTIGIVGLGGTGSHVLDLVAKTPVAAIHLFDADRFEQHNAFRCPGAAGIGDVGGDLTKVAYLTRVYSRLHLGIVPHENRIDARTAPLLDVLDFAFVCIDDSAAKGIVLDRLAERRIPAVDVGMGLEVTPDGVVGAVRTTMIDPDDDGHGLARVPTAVTAGGIYSANVQIAELNALNAALAVIAWKRRCGFYGASTTVSNQVFVVEEGALHRE